RSSHSNMRCLSVSTRSSASSPSTVASSRVNMDTSSSFAPDTLDWVSLERGYSDFVHWALAADLGAFYAELRWPAAEAEPADAGGDVGFPFYPPPFTQQGRSIAGASRRLVPMKELWLVEQEYVRQLAAVPEATEAERRERP